MLYKFYAERMDLIKISEAIQDIYPEWAKNILGQIEAQETRRAVDPAYRYANREKINARNRKNEKKRKERAKKNYERRLQKQIEFIESIAKEKNSDNKNRRKVSTNTKTKKSMGNKVYRVSKASKRSTSLHREKSRQKKK